jgi:hypothetical protein
MYTCPEREAVWRATMTRWRATDWGEDPTVIVDSGSGPTSTARLLANARRMFAAAAREDADYFLLMEDDLVFNLHLRHNLARWEAVRDGWLWLGSVYDPGLPPAPEYPTAWGDRFRVACRGHYYSGLGIVASRRAVEAVLREWDQHATPYDIRLAAIAEHHSAGVALHHPGLVQHVCAPSTWGDAPSRSANFDPFFRADD